MRQFLDRAEWQGHIKKHIEELDGCKVPVCPHPRPQCEEAFESVPKLIFHLQDVHCWVPRKGVKRRRSEDEAELMPRKAKRQSKAKSHEDACGKQEYQFVDEGPKIWALDLQDSRGSISSKSSTLSADRIADPDEQDAETLFSSYSQATTNIDPELLLQSPQLGLEPLLDLQNHDETAVFGYDVDDEFKSFDDMNRILNHDDHANGAAPPTFSSHWHTTPFYDQHAMYGDSSMVQPMAA